MPSWHSHSSTQSEPSCDQVFFWFQFVPHRSNQTLSPTQSYRDQCHQSRLAKDNAVTLKCHLLSCLPKIMCNSPKSHPNCPHFVSNPTCQHIHSQACFHKVQMPHIASKESIPFFTKYSHTKPPSRTIWTPIRTHNSSTVIYAKPASIKWDNTIRWSTTLLHQSSFSKPIIKPP